MLSWLQRKSAHSPTLDSKNNQSLLSALWLTFLPHFFYLPLILTVMIIAVLSAWQWLNFTTGSLVKLQNKWLQYPLVIIGLIVIYSQYGTFFGVDAGCAFLALMLLAKAFEVKNYRDAIVEFNFALFVIAGVFLYAQSLLLAVAVLLAVISIFYGMYQLQSYHHGFEEIITQDVSRRDIRKQAFFTIIKVVLLATPLMVVLFLFFPRFPPLWHIPTPSDQAKTGISDEMSPGDIASLSQSRELAFRAVFDRPQQIPEKSQLYWRATVLENFDGNTWTQNNLQRFAQPVRLNHLDKTLPPWYTATSRRDFVPYHLIIEPTQQTFIYALDYSVAAQPLLLKPDLSVQSFYELTQRRRFQLAYITPQPQADMTLSERSYRINTRLPSHKNPQSQAFAKRLLAQSHGQPEVYAQAVLQWIHSQPFRYTLSPPLLTSEHRVDEFLFSSKAGFCEHYASLYANLMRMAGIPARVVVGYQGGQPAPDGLSWEVRQMDAHAWVEIWLAHRGWVRIDPTAAVAPQRIEQGMANYQQGNESVWGEDGGFGRQLRTSPWLMNMQIWADYVNYQWQDKVVGFDNNRQRDWLKRWSIDALSVQILLLTVLFLGLFALLMWWVARQQKYRQPPLQRALQQCSQALQKQGLARASGEPVLTWLKRIEQQHGNSEMLTKIQQLYQQHTYIAALDKRQLKQLLVLLKQYGKQKRTER